MRGISKSVISINREAAVMSVQFSRFPGRGFNTLTWHRRLNIFDATNSTWLSSDFSEKNISRDSRIFHGSLIPFKANILSEIRGKGSVFVILNKTLSVRNQRTLSIHDASRGVQDTHVNSSADSISCRVWVFWISSSRDFWNITTVEIKRAKLDVFTVANRKNLALLPSEKRVLSRAGDEVMKSAAYTLFCFYR